MQLVQLALLCLCCCLASVSVFLLPWWVSGAAMAKPYAGVFAAAPCAFWLVAQQLASEQLWRAPSWHLPSPCATRKQLEMGPKDLSRPGSSVTIKQPGEGTQFKNV